MTKKVREKRERSNVKDILSNRCLEQLDSKDNRIWMIQMLIPLGLKAVEDMLQEEVKILVGERYSRGNANKRWGTNPGSVFLGDQKVSLGVPRVRDSICNKEVELESYQKFQSSKVIDELVLARLLNGVSTRKYERAAACVPETFGIKKNSVSRKFIKATAAKLKEFNERDLSIYDIVAIFLDGKTFAENEIILALGITIEGKKIPLGFIESSTENFMVCRDFLNLLKDRGLRTEHEILFIIDGAKGLYKGIKQVFSEKGIIQRCQWHKRENVMAYLPKTQQVKYRKKLQQAYQQPTYRSAKQKLMTIRKELMLINQSAVNSLEEGLEETLTLHRLALFTKLGKSFKTTNCIEALNRQIGIYTDRVTYWKNSNQRQRWVTTALLEIEPHLNRVFGYKHLPQLRVDMKFYALQKASKAA